MHPRVCRSLPSLPLSDRQRRPPDTGSTISQPAVASGGGRRAERPAAEQSSHLVGRHQLGHADQSALGGRAAHRQVLAHRRRAQPDVIVTHGRQERGECVRGVCRRRRPRRSTPHLASQRRRQGRSDRGRGGTRGGQAPAAVVAAAGAAPLSPCFPEGAWASFRWPDRERRRGRREAMPRGQSGGRPRRRTTGECRPPSQR